MKEITYKVRDLLDGTLSALTPPAKLAVFGHPVSHSRSPVMHNAALQALGIDAQYVKIEARPDELREALRALPKMGFIGANITTPYKNDALGAIDESDEYTRRSGAVNTIVVQRDRLIGFNTDGPGFAAAIQEELSRNIRDLHILLLGSGGAARAIAFQCLQMGCKQLILANRTLANAQSLAQTLTSYYQNNPSFNPDEQCQVVSMEEVQKLGHIDLVINATSIGKDRTEDPILPPHLLNRNFMVYDINYVGGNSCLVEEALAAGAQAANGLSMLLHQGALAFEHWFNRPAPRDVMRKALQT